MPDTFRTAAKFWIGLVVAALTAASAVADLPNGVTIALAVLTAIGVYLVPNAAPELDHGPEGPGA